MFCQKAPHLLKGMLGRDRIVFHGVAHDLKIDAGHIKAMMGAGIDF